MPRLDRNSLPGKSTVESHSECWILVPNFLDYEVSDFGRVRRTFDSEIDRRGRRRKTFKRVLKPQSNSGYLMVRLTASKFESVHRLVLSAFVGPCPVGYEVNHKDGVKTNNTLCNLEYVTHKENIQHAALLGLMPKGERNGRAILIESQVREIKSLLDLGHTSQEIANRLKVKRTCVVDIKRGKAWGWLE